MQATRRDSSSLWGLAAVVLLLIPLGVAVFLMMDKEKPPAAKGSSAFDVASDRLDAALRADQERQAALARISHTPGLGPAQQQPKAAPDNMMAFYKPSGRSGTPQPSGSAQPGAKPGAVPAALKGLSWAADIIRDPAGFMLRHTYIGKPETARRFLRDPARVEAYLKVPVVRYVLEKPAVAAALLHVPNVVSTALKSPAAKDPEVIKGIVDSGLLTRVLESPSVSALLNNPKLLGRIASDPEVAKTLTNPAVTDALMSSPRGMEVITALSGNVMPGARPARR